MKLHRIGLCLMIATFSQAGITALSTFANADEAIIEDFEQGFPAGDQLRDHEDWFFEEGNSGPVAVESGVLETVGGSHPETERSVGRRSRSAGAIPL